MSVIKYLLRRSVIRVPWGQSNPAQRPLLARGQEDFGVGIGRDLDVRLAAGEADAPGAVDAVDTFAVVVEDIGCEAAVRNRKYLKRPRVAAFAEMLLGDIQRDDAALARQQGRAAEWR